MTEREPNGRNAANHKTLREWLPLAVAGALAPEEQAELDRHVAGCEECAAELDHWRVLAGRLKRLPTPQPSPLLVTRVRARLEEIAAEQAEKRRSRSALVFLVLFSWVLTLAAWPFVRYASQGVANWLEIGVWTNWLGLVWYTALTWLTGGVAAGVLAWQKQRERRLA